MTAQTDSSLHPPPLEKPIAIPTISEPPTWNLRFIGRICPLRLLRRAHLQRGRHCANLLVTIPAADGTTCGGTYPPVTQTSYLSPVSGRRPVHPARGGYRAYGRGVREAKGFLAAALLLLPRAAKLRTCTSRSPTMRK